MTKNVTVTDENGTYVGTTYPKRAKGLVKNGRALFVDDCTIRLSGKTEPSDDTLIQSEVKQMNYIYFNPREWSLEQTQFDTQYQNGNGFGYFQQNPNRQVSADRSFINDFDGSLVESLMLGGWNEAYVRVTSGALPLLPDTENCFVFWLNGGENDKNSEICQLQITFFGNLADCYTYKLNRNYIKPLLHRQGWELYSIPFKTPSSVQASVDTRFSFVSGNAPMAVKPARELSFYQEWKDEPDEFADSRPQRHNLVFEDGWPAIHMYGGDKYSTEALRRKKAQSTRQMAEFYKENAERQKNQTDEWAELSEQFEECKEGQAELNNRQEELSERCYDLQTRYGELKDRYPIGEQEQFRLDAEFDQTKEWDSGFSAFLALDAQLSCAWDMISGKHVPIEAAEGLLDGIEAQLDGIEEFLDNREELLDELEELMDEIEDEESETEED